MHTSCCSSVYAIAIRAVRAYSQVIGHICIIIKNIAVTLSRAFRHVKDRCVAQQRPLQGRRLRAADIAVPYSAVQSGDHRLTLLISTRSSAAWGGLAQRLPSSNFDVRPDLITLAKALANGLPIGALLVDGKVADVLQPGDHGSTFGGSPIPCAVALAHLRVRDELRLNDRVRERSEQLFCGLRNLSAAHPRLYGEPRGIGLLAGLPIVPPYEAGPIVAGMRDQRVLVGTAGENTIRIAPPLIIDSVAIGQLLRALGQVASEPIAPELER